MIVALCLQDHRHAAHDAVALGADAEEPAAGGRAVREPGCSASSPGKLNRNGFGSPPKRGDAQRPPAARLACGTGIGRPVSPSTTLRPLHGVGHDLVVARAGRAACCGSLRRGRDRASAASAGDSRSGSANMTSKPMAAAPSWVRRVIRSATRVRGHGHWPSLRRLASSISTMTTGRCVGVARLDHLKEIEGPQPQFFERAGIGDAQDQQREQQHHAQNARGSETAAPDEKAISCRTSRAQLNRRGCRVTSPGTSASADRAAA